jgi:nicotinamide-nucleotide amidase
MFRDLATELLSLARTEHIMIVTAESCTGGLVGSELTAIAGSSDAYDRGFITYSYESKTEILGVPADVIKKHGAVSIEVVEAMAVGAIKNSMADLSIAITGIAGPTGATETKPVGYVWIALCYKGRTYSFESYFKGNRDSVRQQSCERSLRLAISLLKGESFKL